MMNDVPALAASTPTEDGVFGFETPSPKSSRQEPKAATKDVDVLPHHYGGQEFFTPAEKIGTALRRFQLRFFASPFNSPRRLEEKFGGSRSIHGFWLPTVGVMLVVMMFSGYWYWSRTTTPAAPAEFTFRPMPVSNSPSRNALKRFRHSFKTNKGGWIGVDDPLNPGSVFCLLDGEDLATDMETKEFALGFETYLIEHLTTLLHRMGHDDLPQARLVDVTSYFSLEKELPHIAESKYATPNGSTILVEIAFVVPPSAKEYVSLVIDTIQRYGELHSPDYVDVTYTGLPLFQSEMVLSTNEMRPLDTLLPSTQPSMVAHRRFASFFGPGRLSPYRIVFDASPAGEHANTKEAFEIMHNVMETFPTVDAAVAPVEEEMEEDLEMMMGMGVVNLDSIPQRTEDGHLSEHLGEVMDEMYGETGFKEKDKAHPVYGAHGREEFKVHQRTTYDGAAYLHNNPVPYPLYLAAGLCLSHNKPYCPVELLHLFNYLSEKYTSHDGTATYVTATLGFDPFSEEGVRWLVAARQKLQELKDHGKCEGFNVYLEGGATLEYDATHETERQSWGSLWIGLILLGIAIKLAPRRIKWKGKDHYFKDV